LESKAGWGGVLWGGGGVFEWFGDFGWVMLLGWWVFRMVFVRAVCWYFSLVSGSVCFVFGFVLGFVGEVGFGEVSLGGSFVGLVGLFFGGVVDAVGV